MLYQSLMIAGLRKQLNLLDDLLRHMEAKPSLDLEDCLFCETRTQTVRSNLRKLRKIKDRYFPQTQERPES